LILVLALVSDLVLALERALQARVGATSSGLRLCGSDKRQGGNENQQQSFELAIHGG
jgi:hypothetical protein